MCKDDRPALSGFGPGISDAGLAHLVALAELRELRLDNAGMLPIEGWSPWEADQIEKPVLAIHRCCGHGSAPSGGLKSLKELNLEGTPASRESVDALQKALPRCKILWDRENAARAAEKGRPEPTVSRPRPLRN